MQSVRWSLVVLCALAFGPRSSAHAQSAAPAEQLVSLRAELPRVPDAKDGERILAEITGGSLDCTVERDAKETRIAAEFTVDGVDAADVTRRAKLVRLYAERASDGTIVVEAVFPGKRMPRDLARISIVAPTTDEVMLKSTVGTVRTKSTTGKLRVRTESGSITVDGHAGPLDARATAGRIGISGVNGAVQATAVDGAVEVALVEDNDEPFRIETRAGSVRVEVGAEFDGVVDMTTTTGTLSIVDPAKRVRPSQHSNSRLVAEIGAALGQSEIRSIDGSVTLAVRQKDAKPNATKPGNAPAR